MESILLLLTALLASCASWGTATTVPQIHLSKNDITIELEQKAFAVTALAISSDGRHLLTGDNGGITGGRGEPWLRLWDLREIRQVTGMADPSGTVTAIDISHDSRYALSGGIALPGGADARHALSLWDLASGTLLKSFDTSRAGHEISSLGFSGDGGRFLITTLADGDVPKSEIRVFDTNTRELIKVLSPPREPGYIDYQLAAFSPDGKYILSGGPSSILRLWDTQTWKEVRAISGHKQSEWGGLSSLAISPDGRNALSSGWYDEYVRLWDLETGQEVRRFFSTHDTDAWYKANVLGTAISSDWKQLLILSRTPKVYGLQTGNLEAEPNNLWKGLQTVSGGKHQGVPATARYHPNGRHIYVTMTDAAVRIYNSDSGDEEAVLVGFSDGEWLAITAEGYYNASEKGAQYLVVKVGEEAYRVDQFYDVFYRPDIVAAKLRGDDISGLVSITMKDAIKTPPPTIDFTSSDTDKAKAKICYQTKSTGGGIGEVRLFHNGKLIESDGYYREAAKGETPTSLAMNSQAIYADLRSVTIKGSAANTSATTTAKGDSFSDCKEIDTITGENEISITAFNRDNTIQGAMKSLKFTSKTPAAEPQLYVLAVGINEYRDKSITLKYAAKDAHDFGEKLIAQAGTVYKPQNIHYEVLTDASATKAAITSKISELAKAIKPGDSFILFVAGHGILLQNQYYLLTNDYDGTMSTGSMLSSNEIVEISKRIKALSQLLIFDTCHAGGVDNIVSGLYDARMSVLAKKMGLHIYASASSKEAALDGYRGNGLFTHTLLDGLGNKREADSNKDKAISLIELGDYTRQTTADRSKTLGHTQTPLIINFGKDSPVYQLQ